MKFMGYVRPDGRVGIRNHIAVIPASVCASTVAARIAEQVEGAIALPNQHGCAQIGPDLAVTARPLAGLGTNPT
jgi:altronate dehydratase large subunit